jgi:hypothetical protein
MKHLIIVALLAVTSCSTEQQQKVNAYLASPAGQALERTALAAANNALQQYEDTGKVRGKEVAQASLSSVSQQLRGLQATEAAANPAAIKDAVKNGSASPVVTKKVAPAVAAAVADAVKKGAPADAANEAAARGLDKAAAKP